MKKVLLISHLPPPSGGIATWTKRVLSSGLSDGWEIDHINSNMINGRDMAHKKRNFKDEWVRSKSIWDKEKEFLKTDPDIKVVHTNIPCTVFGIIRETFTGKIAKKHGKKFILHCHCTVPNVINSWYKKILFKSFIKLCDGIIVLNQKSYDFVKEQNSNVKVDIIPNFVLKRELNFDKTKIIEDNISKVLFVGGVTAEKGCDTIIQAARKMPHIQFNLIGAPNVEIKRMEIPENVKLHGVHDSEYVKQQYDENDLFLFLSRYWGEGFSCALTEAMASGLPCIVTDHAANAQMIGYGEGGVIVEKQNPEALIDAINLLSDKKIRQQKSNWNVETVKRHYTEDVVLCQYTNFYERVIED